MRTMVQESDRGMVRAFIGPGANILQNVWREDGEDRKLMDVRQ